MVTVKKGAKKTERISWKARALKAEAEVRRLSASEFAVQTELGQVKTALGVERETVASLGTEKTELVRENEALALRNYSLQQDVNRWRESGVVLEVKLNERRLELATLNSIASVLAAGFLDKRSIPDAMEEFLFHLDLLGNNTASKDLREVIARVFQGGSDVTFRLLRERKARIGTPGDNNMAHDTLDREVLDMMTKIFSRRPSGTAPATEQ